MHNDAIYYIPAFSHQQGWSNTTYHILITDKQTCDISIFISIIQLLQLSSFVVDVKEVSLY